MCFPFCLEAVPRDGQLGGGRGLVNPEGLHVPLAFHVDPPAAVVANQTVRISTIRPTIGPKTVHQSVFERSWNK